MRSSNRPNRGNSGDTVLNFWEEIGLRKDFGDGLRNTSHFQAERNRNG